jgi:DNA-binding SARP family transcriptional activator/TolB-like protein
MLQIQTLGALSLGDSDGVKISSVVRQPKRAAILLYLTLAHPRGDHRREALFPLFWPESDESSARHALNQALYALRRSLGDHVLHTTGRDTVGVDREALSCDVITFEAALGAEHWEEALDLYAGPFLRGFHLDGAATFERWVEEERERLRELAARAAWELARLRLERGEPVEAETAALRAVRLLPTDEGWVREFVTSLAAAGERSAAVRFYELWAAQLAEELELEPAPETVAVVGRIRRGRWEHPVPVSTDAGAAEAGRPLASAPGAVATPARVGAHGDAELVSTDLVPSHRLGSAVRGTRTVTKAGLGAAVVLATAALTFLGLDGWVRRGLPDRVYVSAFENRTGDATLDPLGRRVSDAIAQGFLEANFVEVVDPRITLRDSRDYGEGESADPAVVGRRVRARLVVLGSYYRQGDSLLFNAEVHDAQGGRIVGATPAVATTVAHPTAGLGLLYQKVMGILAMHLDQQSDPLDLLPVGPPTYDAYRDYMEGIRHSYVWGRFRDAYPLFRQAFDRDPDFLHALLHALLTHYAIHFSRYARASDAVRDSLETTLLGREAELTSTDQAWLEYLLASRDDDFEAMYRSCRRRVGGSSAAASALWDCGLTAARSGRSRQAVEWFEAMDPSKGWVRLNPYPYFRNLAWQNHLLGDHQRELRVAIDGVELHPDVPLLRIWVARAAAASSESTMAEQEVERAIEDNPHSAEALHARVWVGRELIAHGAPDAGRRLVARALDEFHGPPTSWSDVFLALGHYLLEDHEPAALYAERVLERQDSLIGPRLYSRVLLARILAHVGHAEEARRMARPLEEARPFAQRISACLGGAAVEAILGNKDAALSLLRNWEPGEWSQSYLHPPTVDPDFASLRGDPAFAAILSTPLGAPCNEIQTCPDYEVDPSRED